MRSMRANPLIWEVIGGLAFSMVCVLLTVTVYAFAFDEGIKPADVKVAGREEILNGLLLATLFPIGIPLMDVLDSPGFIAESAINGAFWSLWIVKGVRILTVKWDSMRNIDRSA